MSNEFNFVVCRQNTIMDVIDSDANVIDDNQISWSYEFNREYDAVNVTMRLERL